MATDSKLVLAGDFKAGMKYTIKGETLIAWRKALIADRVVPGPGQLETQTPQGRVISGGGSGGTAGPVYAAFFRTYIADGKHKLQGGQVTGGTGNEDLDDIELATSGSEPVDGTRHWLEITGDGTVTDEVLYAGYDVTNASVGHGSSLPANTLPTKDSDSGRKCHVLLGIWTSGQFVPSSAGNVHVTFCPGTGYSVSRF